MKPKILIVDDEKKIRDLVAFHLEAQGFQVAHVENGVAALQMAQQYHPKMIVLDIMIPAMNGLEVCKQLKANAETQGIKVLLLSAKGQKEDETAGFAAGADAYIAKPFRAKQLLETIERLLQ